MTRKQQTDTSRPQREFIEQCRRDSVIGPNVPLCLNAWHPHPERGPTVAQWMRDKANRQRGQQ